jgi:hypothetical protein
MIKQIQGNTLKFDGWNKLKENEIVFLILQIILNKVNSNQMNMDQI